MPAIEEILAENRSLSFGFMSMSPPAYFLVEQISWCHILLIRKTKTARYASSSFQDI